MPSSRPPRPPRLEDYPGVFNKLIAARMRKLGHQTLKEFAKYAGIGSTTLYNLVLGRVTESGVIVKPSIDTLVQLARALEEPVDKLLFMLVPDAPGAESWGDQPPARRFRVRVAGWVGAGPEQFEEISGSWVVVEEDFARGKQLQAFRVRGDSMAAGKRPIHDGDIVLVNTLDKGYNTAAVVARLMDGRYICKMYREDHFGRFLVSANAAHTNGTPVSIKLSEVDEVIGRVVRIISSDDQLVEEPPDAA